MSTFEVLSPARIETVEEHDLFCPKCGKKMLVQNYFKKKKNILVLMKASCKHQEGEYYKVASTIEDLKYYFKKDL